MRTSALPDRCMIWSGLYQRVIDEAIDHVAWTARACMRTDGRDLNTCSIIWTLIDCYHMTIVLLCGDFVFDAVGLLHAVKIVVRCYTLQCEHMKRDVWRAFRGYQHRWPWTTLNPKIGGFSKLFLDCKLRGIHKEWIFAEITGDKPR